MLFAKYNIHIDHHDTYTLTARDYVAMKEKGLVPGVVLDEVAYLHDCLAEFPDVFIGKYCMRESAYDRSVKFPNSSVIVSVIV